jgi:hypothetical protein
MFSAQVRQTLLTTLLQDHGIALPPEKCVEETLACLTHQQGPEFLPYWLFLRQSLSM